jgi:hypothetical protein
MDLFLRPIPRLAATMKNWDDLVHALMGDADARIRVWELAEIDNRIWTRVSIGEMKFESWAYPWSGSISPGVYRVVGENKTRFMRMVTNAVLAFRFDCPFPGSAQIPGDALVLTPTRIEFQNGTVICDASGADAETSGASGSIQT